MTKQLSINEALRLLRESDLKEDANGGASRSFPVLRLNQAETGFERGDETLNMKQWLVQGGVSGSQPDDFETIDDWWEWYGGYTGLDDAEHETELETMKKRHPYVEAEGKPVRNGSSILITSPGAERGEAGFSQAACLALLDDESYIILWKDGSVSQYQYDWGGEGGWYWFAEDPSVEAFVLETKKDPSYGLFDYYDNWEALLEDLASKFHEILGR